MIKKKIGIVAKKLNHSLSPLIHNIGQKIIIINLLIGNTKYEKDIDKFFNNYRRDNCRF